jgi:hypothetical protein
MTKKSKDGITEFTKALIILATNLKKSQYDKVFNVMFALHNGVCFGYKPEFDPQMMTDANDLFKFHSTNKKENNVVKLKLVKGGKDENVKL